MRSSNEVEACLKPGRRKVGLKHKHPQLVQREQRYLHWAHPFISNQPSAYI